MAKEHGYKNSYLSDARVICESLAAKVGARRLGEKPPRAKDSVLNCFAFTRSPSYLLRSLVISPDSPGMSPGRRMRAPSVAGKCNWDQSTLLFSDVKPGSSFDSQQDSPCEQDEPTSPKVSCIGQVQVNMPKKLRLNLDNEGKIINQQNNGKFPFTRSAFLLLQRRKTPKTMQRLDLKGAEKTEATVSNPNCKFDLTRSTSAREISVCRSTVNRKSPSMGGILEQSLELLEAKYKQNNQKIPGSKAPEQRDELPSEAVQNSPKTSSEICIWKRRCFAEPLRLSLQRPPPVGSS